MHSHESNSHLKVRAGRRPRAGSGVGHGMGSGTTKHERAKVRKLSLRRVARTKKGATK
jgi:hypothetical protein